MAVYIDDLKLPYGRMLMSHMVADSVDELHEMANQIGLQRKWFQDYRIPHYDVSQRMKARALKMGAIEVSSKELIRIVRSTP